MVNSNANRIGIITGSSSGIRFQTALTLARNGFYTYATMRNLKKSKSIKDIVNKEALPLKIIVLDVDDDNNNESSAKTAIQEIIFEKRTQFNFDFFQGHI
jgi:NAD(P)-dependent dehydrogenase (short-subunit alcohol dehydrogenase family)